MAGGIWKNIKHTSHSCQARLGVNVGVQAIYIKGEDRRVSRDPEPLIMK